MRHEKNIARWCVQSMCRRTENILSLELLWTQTYSTGEKVDLEPRRAANIAASKVGGLSQSNARQIVGECGGHDGLKAHAALREEVQVLSELPVQVPEG